MNIAIVGSGIAGNVAAYHLAREHEITVFEAGAHVGGHTNTIDVELDGERHAVDTGFIVFNDWTYPNFIRLIDELGVAWHDSDMSFSVKCERTGLEYNGSTLNSLFAQRRNLFRPSFHRMIRHILRFHREAPAMLADDAPDLTLGEYLAQNGYSREFRDHYIVPMGAAIWSADPGAFDHIPARFFIRFFDNHGMLSVDDRPTWRVITGGSARYVEKLTAGFADRIRLDSPVEKVVRHDDHVEVHSRHGVERFDAIFLACHSDQALSLLADPTPAEREVLGAIRYQPNEAVLHTDTSLMPRRKLAWAAWNYHLLRETRDRVALTYNMNILQGLPTDRQFMVTLNHTEAIDPRRVIEVVQYEHPVFTPEAVAAQQRHGEIDGAKRTYYCGAYWRNGFHEDGVVSALDAVNHFNEAMYEELYLRRAG